MLTRPVPRCGFILSSSAVMASTEISASFGVLVLSEIGIVSMPVGYFFDLVPFFPEDDKLLFAPFRGAFGFVKTSKGFTVVLYSTRRQAFESFSSHLPSASLQPP